MLNLNKSEKGKINKISKQKPQIPNNIQLSIFKHSEVTGKFWGFDFSY